MPPSLHSFLATAFLALLATATSARASEAASSPASVSNDLRSAGAAAILSVDAPLPGPLAHGAVVIPFHADHLQIAPVYGAAAAQVLPPIGHLHLTLDGANWHWVQASNDLIVLQGLAAGPHTLRVDLADANHAILDSRTVAFVVPSR